MDTDSRQEPDDERSEAVRQADAGAQAWRAVVHAQRTATPDHADFYSLAGHLVDTLASVESLARVLTRQVDNYADGLPAGSRVYDDTRCDDPLLRLETATSEAVELIGAARDAGSRANRFWSAIGHIGVEDVRS